MTISPPLLLGVSAEPGLGIGLMATAFGFGFRHGIDWDHLAAITDIAGSQETPRRSMLYSSLYALGHALVVSALGLLAIVLAVNLPSSVDSILQRIVGVTLIVLAIYVVHGLVTRGRDFRMRSRWMVAFAGARRGVRWLRRRADPENERAVATQVDDSFVDYGRATSLVVGMIHGIGAETPTQVLIFLAAAGAAGRGAGVALLACFVLGLFSSNTVIALVATYGFLSARASSGAYLTVSVVTASFSLVMGTLFLMGRSTLLPAIFGAVR